MVEPGFEPGTSWLVVRSSDHQTTRLVILTYHIQNNANFLFIPTCHLQEVCTPIFKSHYSEIHCDCSLVRCKYWWKLSDDGGVPPKHVVECFWNLMAQGDAREGKWRGNWRIEWVASTPTLPRNVVYPAFLKPMRTPRLPAVDWTDAPADLNGLVRFGERWNLVSARVPPRFKSTIVNQKLYCLVC